MRSGLHIIKMEVDAITGPPTSVVKAEEGSQKGEKATYKSFKYVMISLETVNAANVLCTCLLDSCCTPLQYQTSKTS
jgi:hypothetical protein